MVRRFAGLPLLKGTTEDEDVSLAFETAGEIAADESLPNSLRVKMGNLVNYMDRTWIRHNAKFAISIWSRFNIEGNVRLLTRDII